MSELHRQSESTADNEQSLQELAWAIAMSEGQFSLFLAHCNYAASREQIVQRLREVCSVEIREIVLNASVEKLYSTIREQLGDQHPKAVMVFGLGSVSDIDQVLTSMNQVREEFRKNFPFPIVLWVNDEILKKLIRLAPDFESWATTVEFEIATDEVRADLLEPSTHEVRQRPDFEDLITFNQNSLVEICRALTLDEGQFSVILAHCNYAVLREKIVQHLQKVCPVKFRELILDRSVKKLYSSIHDKHGQKQPPALMVFGLESVNALDQVLNSLDQDAEKFRDSFQFPLVLWITDEVSKKLIRLAPEFNSWTASPIYFRFATDTLIVWLQSITARVFSAVLNAGANQFLPNTLIIKPLQCLELESALRELQYREQELDPGLQAELEFFLGRNGYVSDRLTETLAHYQQSLKFWQQNENLERQGVLLFHIGLCYLRKAELDVAESHLYWQEARRYLQQCINVFEQAQSLHLVANFSKKLGEVLQCLEAWDDLQALAQKSLTLHQNYGNQIELARDYGFLAEVALKHSNWEEANQLSQQALQILANSPEEQRQDQGLYRLLLAKSQRQLDQLEKAVETLETAKQGSDSQDNPKLYISILEELRSLYSKQGQYLEAFQIKREQRSIERQYGLAAFVGADQLQPQKTVKPQQAEFDTQEAIALEIEASGRQYHVNRLIERISRSDCKLIVLQGQSGVGKSSLLNAGLVPALKHRSIGDRDCLLITLRVYTDWVKALGKSLMETLEETRGLQLPATLDSAEAILEQLRENVERNRLTVLIFDQFEEFFFVYTERAKRRLFFEFLGDCLNIPFVKVILSMREDYLHYLLELNRLTNLEIINNDILDKRTLYYLENFSSEDAKSLIYRLTQRANFYLEPDLVDQLVDDLAGELREVRPIELQIVGMQLQAENITTLTDYKERGSKERLVRRFLEEVVEDCGSENENAAWSILYLLTNENGTRPLKTDTELAVNSELEPKKLEFLLDVLVKAGILFSLPETSTKLYQLVHDYLVFFIRQKHGATLLVELKLTKGQLRQALIQEQQERQRAEIAEITALSSLSQALLLSHDQLGALVAGVAAGRKLRQIEAPSEVKIKTICRLRQVVYSVRERNRFQGHEAGVTSISFSPDGQTLASASEDGTVKLWYIDGSQAKTFQAHSNRVTSVSFSSSGQTLASASGDGTVKLWRLDGSEVQTFQSHSESVINISFSPDGHTLASAGADGTVKLWHLDDSQMQLLHEHHDLVYDFSFSPDGQILACASEDGMVKLWYLDSNQLQSFKGHSERVTSVSFSPNGQTLVSASLDGTVKLWCFNSDELQELRTFQAHRDWISSISFSPDGQSLASASEDGTVKLWSLDGNELETFRSHADKVTSISFSPDGQTIASAGGEGTVKLWCLKGNQLQTCRGHADKVTSVSFNPDGQTLASADENGIVKLWCLDGTELETIRNHTSRVTSLSFSSDGQTLASADEDGRLEFWCSDGDKLLFPLMHNYGVTSISFSPNSQTLAFAGEDGTIELWSKDGADMQASCKHGERVTSISFSPNNQTFACASLDGTVKLWRFNVTKLQELRTFQAHNKIVTSLSFSPNGQNLATASEDCTAKTWSLDGTELQIFRGHKKTVTSVSFSPDGQTLATSGEDGTVKLWSLDGTELQTFQGHSNWVTGISFSPDGKTLASAGQDRTVILWNLDLDDLLARACNWLRDYLKTNLNVSESDRKLCDDILTRQ